MNKLARNTLLMAMAFGAGAYANSYMRNHPIKTKRAIKTMEMMVKDLMN